MKCKITLLLFLIASQFSISNAQSVSPRTSPDSGADKKKIEQEQKRLQKQAEIHGLVIRATNQSLEVSADLIFAILDAKLIETPQRKIELLEELGRRASLAKEPYRLKFYEGVVDSRSGFKGYASGLGLDTLAIQLNLVRRMLSLDKVKARKLFTELPQLKPASLECEDDFGYDFSEYYALLKSVAETTFGPEEVLRRQDVYFVASYLEDLRSPSQVAPVIDMLSSTRFSGSDLEILVDAFILGLRRIGIDPRSFASAIKYDKTSQKLWQALVPRMQQNGIPTLDLEKAYRAYAMKQISTAQCSDSLMISTEEVPHPVIVGLEKFTRSSIAPEDTKPEEIKPGAKPFQYWTSVKAAKLLQGIKSLRFGSSNTALSSAERNSAEWLRNLMEYLQEMDSWKEHDEETPMDFLNQKSVIFDSLFELAPQGILRTQILQSYAIFLRDSSLRKETPGHWLFFVKRLFRMAKSLPPHDFAKFLDEIGRVGNDSLAVYAEFEKFKLKYASNATVQG